MLKEPEIRLFGMKISLPENGTVAAGGECSGDSSNESSNENGSSVNCELEVSREQERGDGEEKQEQGDEDQTTGELCVATAEEEDKNPEDCQHPNALSESDDNPKTPPNEEDVMSDNQPKPENEINGPQKALKKPDKILPCPRCNSMDTKFCYYNNYNVNQPRHFCKSCQRYWTAGGTMRNVPVGAGRRKNKNMGSHCRHFTISEALRAAQTDTSDRFHNLKIGPNGSVLSFGPDSPLCNSVATTLNLSENRVPNGVSCKVEQGVLVSSRIGENVDDCSIRLGDGTQNRNGFSPPFPCIPGVPWPFPWNSAVPVSPICPPVYSLPYYTAPFWNVQWLSMHSPTTNRKVTGSGPTSPLGKHLRNGELINPNKSEHKEPLKSRSSESPIVVPKTLRIDDPEEAAKSSIWSTLGINYDSFRREGLFKALQPKGDEKKPLVNTCPLLQANPAALSRFISFQERA